METLTVNPELAAALAAVGIRDEIRASTWEGNTFYTIYWEYGYLQFRTISAGRWTAQYYSYEHEEYWPAADNMPLADLAAALPEYVARVAAREAVPQFVNLTPHAVVVMPDGGKVTTVPTSGTIARIAETTRVEHGCTVVELGDITGLPEPAAGVTYIASMPLLMALAAKGIYRPDVVYPYGQVRDEQGRIVGCRELATLRVA